MRFRILLSFIFLLLISWITYVSFDLLQNEINENFRSYFNSDDKKIIVIHNPNEINWAAENFDVLSENEAIYFSIISKIQGETSIFISSKRPLILLERKENWSKKDVRELFRNGLYPFSFTSKQNFSYGKYHGKFQKNQIVIYKGSLKPTQPLKFDLDKKSSYSIISFQNNTKKVCDVYIKPGGSYLYTKMIIPTSKAQMYNDQQLFAHILPVNISNYSFFSASYLNEIDPEFQNSEFNKWVDKGIVFISYKNRIAALFYFKDGQSPMKNLNEKFKIEELNETSGNYKNIPFSTYFPQDKNIGFFIEEFNDFAIISTEKSYLDEIVAEINLGGSLAQEKKQKDFIYNDLPIKVASRIINDDCRKSVNIYLNSLIETEFIPFDKINNQSQKNDKDYFIMNVGDRIKDFLALDERGNLIVLTESNKLIGYINGRRKWEKQLVNNIILKEFKSDKNYFSLLLNGECQIFDKNARMIHRVMATNGIAPLKFGSNVEFLTVNGPTNFSLLNEKGSVIKQFSTNGLIKQIGQYQMDKKNQIGILTQNMIYFLNPQSRSVTKKIACDSSFQLFTDNFSLFYAGITNNSLQIINSNGQSTISKIKSNSSIIGHYFENNNLVLLIKNTNELSAIDHNGIVKWKKIMNLSDISSCSVKSGKNGIILIGILDAIENKLYLLNTSGQFIANQDLKGSEKIQITQFGENAFSISTVLGNAVIQYTKL